jgi:long-chain acyl-CoA synthetase
LVYTSRTTGRPKGVMLSHRNILFNAHAGLRSVQVTSDDSLLSFLPLSHMLERSIGYYLPMIAGCRAA